ncbi:DUF6615 family protein [Nocardia rhamnosiphila]|uniref:DUF6615 family protein n=1 Tax=Nocardia rhamnosiphila TaxID=426716 RepID=UPI0004C3578E|nr:DUF6615 family protein [Nocardia rhamnosiphila]
MNLYELRRDMDCLAWSTWLDYQDGFWLGLEPGEESVTDRVLLELQRDHPENLHVNRYTRTKENEVGADWEWLIGNDDQGWLCLRVQAKRIHHWTYRMLGHEGAREDELQYDTLIRECRKDRAFPYHVFYNGWEPGRFKPKGLPADVAAWQSNRWWARYKETKEYWGCAALSSYQVAALHSRTSRSKRNYAPMYLEHAMPWSALFVTGAPTSTLETPLDLVEKHLIRTTVDGFESYSGDGAPHDLRAGWRRDRLPPYAEAVRAGRATSGLDEVRENRIPPPAHVVVVATIDSSFPRPRRPRKRIARLLP